MVTPSSTAPSAPVTYIPLSDPNPRPGSVTMVDFGGGADWQKARPFRLALNGTDLGLLGGLDEVVIRLWTPQGEITPTPTITPTTTQTPVPSATPREPATPAGAVG